jgi:hypothetical protein
MIRSFRRWWVRVVESHEKEMRMNYRQRLSCEKKTYHLTHEQWILLYWSKAKEMLLNADMLV